MQSTSARSQSCCGEETYSAPPCFGEPAPALFCPIRNRLDLVADVPVCLRVLPRDSACADQSNSHAQSHAQSQKRSKRSNPRIAPATKIMSAEVSMRALRQVLG